MASNVINFINSHSITIIDHSQYSPDLALCDYWLFDYIKQNLDDEESGAESLTTSITNLLKNTPHKEYLKIFNKYIIRLENCILAEGDFFEHYMK